MESLQTKQDLQNAILHLEQRQLLEKNAMQLHYREAQEYLQPSNLLKNAITEITTATDLKKDMLKAAIALAIGYIAKKIVETYVLKTRTPLTIAVETILQIVISGWVAKNGTILKDVAVYFFKTILQHRQQQQQLSESTTFEQ